MKKGNRDNEYKLNKFIQQVISAKIISVQLLPALTIDTTAVPTLRVINQQTRSDYSQNGKILNFTSQKLLNTFDNIQTQFRYKQNLSPSTKVQIKIDQLIQQKTARPTIYLKSKESDKNYLTPNYNDQNTNTMNFQNNAAKPPSYKAKANNILDAKLIEIVRPQYKKKNPPKPIKQKVFELAYPTSKVNRTYVTQEQDSQQIPILKNYKRKNQQLNKDARRSVSPKHEHSKQINNISFISKNYQTQTDHSFQIDLTNLGIVPHKRRYQQANQHRGENRMNKRGDQQFVKTRKELKGQIQQEQPWQCDQQQIQQQIREINQRLSHRAYNRQRVKTQYDITKCEGKNQNIHLHFDYQQPRKKQTKTVRLNLTPLRNKSTGRSQGNKKQIMRTPTNKIQIALKKEAENKYQPQEVMESPIEVECSKWKKPQKGLISLQIQKRVKNR